MDAIGLTFIVGHGYYIINIQKLTHLTSKSIFAFKMGIMS